MTSETLGEGIKSFIGKFLAGSNFESTVDKNTETASNITSEVEATAKDLAYYVVDHYTGGLANYKARRRRLPDCASTMLRVVDQMSGQHQILFSSIVKRLAADRVNIEPTFNNVVNEMFSDNQYNWGRVVTVYAFAGWLARYVCCGKESSDSAVEKVAAPTDTTSSDAATCARQVADLAGEFVAERLGNWVEQQGGWKIMNEFFVAREDPENMLWSGLLYTFLGLGALATMAVVRHS